jgi:hypothetical protein
VLRGPRLRGATLRFDSRKQHPAKSREGGLNRGHELVDEVVPLLEPLRGRIPREVGSFPEEERDDLGPRQIELSVPATATR